MLLRLMKLNVVVLTFARRQVHAGILEHVKQSSLVSVYIRQDLHIVHMFILRLEFVLLQNAIANSICG